MDWYVIVVNDHPFGVMADSMHAAETIATVHLADIYGATTVGQSRVVASWQDDDYA